MRTRKRLEKRKREQNTQPRKILKLGDEFSSSSENEETVEQLEFRFLNESDKELRNPEFSTLSPRNLIILKLIICAGLYPNIGVADVQNYSRPIAEHAYHTKSTKFVSVHPSSVFASQLDVLHQNEASNRKNEDQKELLCFMEILETNKPYMVNPFRVPALPVCILISRKVDISFDFKHFIIDDWIHLQFNHFKDAIDVLMIGTRARYCWLHYVDQQLARWTESSHNRENHRSVRFPDQLFLPPEIIEIHRTWLQVRSDLPKEEVLDVMAEIADIEVEYSCAKLNTTRIPEMFGYDIQRSSTVRCVEVTPHFRYHVGPQVPYDNEQRYDCLLSSRGSSQEADYSEMSSGTSNRQLFECPNCSKMLILTPLERSRHLRSCNI
jgi:hypothetical protein